MENEQRESMFNSWKNKHDKEVKKCMCTIPNPKPTYLNECFGCNGEIYKDYLNKIRWKSLTSKSE